MNSSSEDVKSETSVWTLFMISSLVQVFKINFFLNVQQGDMLLRITTRQSCQGYMVDILRQYVSNHLKDTRPKSNEYICDT